MTWSNALINMFMDVESLFYLARAAVVCSKLNVVHSDHHCAPSHVAWCQRGAVTHCLYSLPNIHPASRGLSPHPSSSVWAAIQLL